LAKLKVLERVRYASRGGPLDCRVAWVVEGSVEGLNWDVVGIWRRKRAAEAVDAKVARVAIENCIVWILGVGEMIVVKPAHVAEAARVASSFGET
jgi:hypothetical protein